MYRDKITHTALKMANSRIASPVIIRVREGKIEEVTETIKPFVESFTDELPLLPIRERYSIPLSLIRTVRRFNIVSAYLPREVIFSLAQSPYIEMIYHDQPMYAFSYPIVPPEGVFKAPCKVTKEVKFTSTLWSKREMGALIAKSKGYEGSGVLVAVPDTGASRIHEQIRRVRMMTAIKQDRDENGHGTHCCTTIGGIQAQDDYLSQRSGMSVVCEGIAPKCDLLAIKCLGYYIGIGSTSSIIAAIDIAMEQNADIISMSLGGPCEVSREYDDPYHAILMEVVSKRKIPIVAAGNEGPSPSSVSTPGVIYTALTVGAYDEINGGIASFSGRGPCFPAETWIAVLDNKAGFRRIRDVKIGQKIWSYNEESRTFEIDEVDEAFIWPSTKDIKEIETERGYKVRATYDHPFYIEEENGNVRLKMVDELQLGDKLVISPFIRNSFGYQLSEVTKARMKGRISPRKGYKFTDEERSTQSKRLIKYYLNHPNARTSISEKLRSLGIKPPSQKGRKWKASVETKKHMSESQKIYWNKQENKNKRIGSKNSFYGKHHTEETKSVIRQKRLQQEFTPISSQEIKLYNALKSYIGEGIIQQYGIVLGPSFASLIDIADKQRKIAIFIDGVYWHRYRKLRDKTVTEGLQIKGWRVIRFTDIDIDGALEECVTRVLEYYPLMSVHNNIDKLISIKRIRNKYPLIYHLKTKKNHNFIANGFVVHNTKWGDTKPDVVAPGVNIDSGIVGVLDTSGDGVFSRYSPLSGTCLIGETLVGDVSIEELVPGDMVPSLFGDDIVLASLDQGHNTIMKVVLEDGHDIEATPEHRFLILRNKRLIWMPLIALNVGDEVVMDMPSMWKKLPQYQPPPPSQNTQYDYERIQGKVPSSICVEPNTLEQGEKGRAKSRTIKANEGQVSRPRMEKGLPSEEFPYWEKPQGKRKFILWTPPYGQVKRGFIETTPRSSYVQYPELIRGYVKGERRTSTLQITDGGRRVSCNSITPFLSSSGLDSYKRWTSYCSGDWKGEDGEIQGSPILRPGSLKTSIVSKIQKKGRKRVYDITTLSHNFIANGIVVHNSMATPHVAGLVALMMESMNKILGERLSVAEIKRMMEKLGATKDNTQGYGRITWQLWEKWLSTEYSIKI